MKHTYRQTVGLGLVVLLLVEMVGTATARAEDFSNAAFQKLWASTDAAVTSGAAKRSFFWGPSPFAHTGELNSETPGGVRQVQYFDKSRMEINQPATDPNNPFYVSNGLLTLELVGGKLRTGDTAAFQRFPAEVPVAGDSDGNGLAPTYASFSGVTTLNGDDRRAPNRTGQSPIVSSIRRDGSTGALDNLPADLKYATYIEDTGHNIAAPFWTYLNQAPLKGNDWVSVMGYPVAEPFWAADGVIVGGQKRDVLIQLFQRRVLTYTPANPAEFQVEMGNIGQHYYRWRYNLRGPLDGRYRVLMLNAGGDLITADANGSNRRVLTEGSPKVFNNNYSVAPDGKAVLYQARDGLYIADLVLNQAPFKVNLNVPLTVTQFAWNADSSRYAIVGTNLAEKSTAQTRNVQVYEVARTDFGAGVARVLETRRNVTSLSYGNGGNTLFVALEGGQTYAMQSGRPETFKPLALLSDAAGFSYSPQDNRIAYDDQSGIHIYSPNSGKQLNLGEPAALARFVGAPIWSPDSSRIVYADLPAGTPGGSVFIKLVDVQANTTRLMTAFETENYANLNLLWSADSTRLTISFTNSSGQTVNRLFQFYGPNFSEYTGKYPASPERGLADAVFASPNAAASYVDGAVRTANFDNTAATNFNEAGVVRVQVIKDGR